MSFGVVAETLLTADMTASPPTYFHRFNVNEMTELKAVRLWVVKYGAPSLGVLGLELRTGVNGLNGRSLISTSPKTWTLAQISASNYSCKEIYFDWTTCSLLAPNVEYTLNLTATSYTGTETNHLAWVRAWPDPIVSFAESASAQKLGVFPFQVGIIGREVRR